MWATKSGAHLRNAPLLLLPWFEGVFFRRSRTVSWDRDSTKPSSTALPASARSVQWSWPSGGRGAGQGHQMRPGLVVQLAVPVGLGPVLEHTVQSVLGETPLDAEHAGLGHVQRLGHLGGGPPFVGLEQDAGPGPQPWPGFCRPGPGAPTGRAPRG